MNFCIPLFHSKYFSLFKNKYFEFQVDKMEKIDYFNIHLKWTRKVNHAGISFYFEVFGLFLSAEIYDNRHWNYKEDSWE